MNLTIIFIAAIVLVVIMFALVALRILKDNQNYKIAQAEKKVLDQKAMNALSLRAFFEKLKNSCAGRLNKNRGNCAGCPDYDLCTEITVGAPADWDVEKFLNYGKRKGE